MLTSTPSQTGLTDVHHLSMSTLADAPQNSSSSGSRTTTYKSTTMTSTGNEKFSRARMGWLRNAALHTTPGFYAITMGTGITSVLLYKFPYPARWLEILGIIVFVLNIVLFSVITLLSLIRYVSWKGMFSHVYKHNGAGMGWGCLSMGFSTIVNMVCFVCVKEWGENWAYFALALWWLNVIIAIVVNFGMVFAIFARESQTHQSLAATWLLPIVSSVVVAATGAIVAQALMPYNTGLSRSCIVASYAIWGTGVPLALMIITLWVYRTALNGPPAPGALSSVFLPIGPCGQGSFGIIQMGVTARQLAYEHGTPMIPSISADGMGMKRIADAMFVDGLIFGLILWGLALLWYTMALLLFIDQWRRDWTLLGPGKFVVGLWALTFPIGVFATSTIALGQELDSPAFRAIGAVLAVQVILHWFYVAFSTTLTAVTGGLFAAPEIKDAAEQAFTLRWRRNVEQRDQGVQASWGGEDVEAYGHNANL